MAMNVKFLRGLITGYNALAEKNADTLYFCTDGALYLGSNLIADKTDLSAVNAAIDAINKAGYQNADQVSAAISAAIAAENLGQYAKTADIQSALDKANSALQASDKTELEGKINAKENAGVAAGLVDAAKTELQGKIDLKADASTAALKTEVEAVNAKFADYRKAADQDVIDAAQDKALTDYKAEMVETLKGYESAGAAAQALADAKEYSDGKLNAVVEQYLTGEGAADTIDTLNEIANWINSDEAGATKIIKDVAANAQAIADEKAAREAADTTINGEIDGIQAQLNGIAAGDGTVKAAIDAALAEAKKYADDNDANTVYDDTALAGRVSAIEGKLPDGTIADTDDVAAAVADKATKTELSDGLALKADKATYEAYVEAHKDDYNNAKIDELVGAASKAGTDAAAQALVDAKAYVDGKDYAGITTADIAAWNAEKGANAAAAAADAKAVAAQGEVDALEEVVAANAKTCSDNFTTISNQLTWGSF